MTPTKVIVFLLGLISLAGLLYSVLLAFGPSLLPLPPPVPLNQLSPGCLGLVLFMFAAPVALLPGLPGLGLWFFVVRKKEAAREREITALPRQEEAFQAHFDGVIQYLNNTPGTHVASTQLQAWIEGLTEPQQRRLRRFLSSYGSSQDRRDLPPDAAMESAEAINRHWNVRTLVQLLFAFGVFFLLWGALVAFTHLETGVLRVLGFEPGLGAAIFGSSGCFILGLTAVLGGLGLRWLLSREIRKDQYLQGFRERAHTLALEGCYKRVERLLLQQGDHTAAESIARAALISALPELDGITKGQLIGRLHIKGLLPRLDLSGANLRGAVLAETDLSGIFLAKADLSGARLTKASLFRADLHQCCLRGADLRYITAEAINLRQADLRDADLLGSHLRLADLNGAELAGANLSKADFTGADLTGTLISAELQKNRP